MGGEVITFSVLFGRFLNLDADIGTIYGKTIQVKLLRDTKSLFYAISKVSSTSEKRIFLDIAAARELFRDKVISDNVFVRSSANVADVIIALIKYYCRKH